MSVKTTADEKLDTAKEHVDNAIGLIVDVLFGKVWGYEQYTREYKNDLMSALADLRKISEVLE